MRAYFIPSVPTFIHESWKHDGTYTEENWPSDAILLTEEETNAYWMIPPPKGQKLGVVKGKPAWVDIPPPTQEELIQYAEREKKRLINVANDFINSKQWPGKAAIGRLKGNELVQYNLWLDYLDSLESTDASTAPDIDWPEMPI
ncbi:TPA: tail fiber assembly protein [Citrobacter freundii]|nr:tail fiber assembly protein [Citrobacter freundii]